MVKENLEESLNNLEEATELILQAKQLIDSAIHGTSLVSHYEAYGRYGINQLLSDGNPYDYGIDYLIVELIEKEEEEE